MSTYALTIGGVTKLAEPNWHIHVPSNGSGTMSFNIFSVDGSYVPSLDQEVIFTEDGTRIFGGSIRSLRERGAANEGGVPIVCEVSAIDFNALAARQYMDLTVASGTLASILATIVTAIGAGVTLSGSQATGPTLTSLSYSGWKISDLLDELAKLTGYTWRIDYNKVLRMAAPGTLNAPYNVVTGDGNALGDVDVEPTRTNFGNHVIVVGNGVTGVASDAASIAASGTWKLLFRTDKTLQADVDSLAALALAASLPTLKIVRYETQRAGLILPGQIQTITLASRHVNNTFLVRELDIYYETNEIARRKVTAIEGLVYQTGWRETLKSWGGVGSGFSIGSGSGGGGITFTRYQYFLGGSGMDYARAPSPGTWIDPFGDNTNGSPIAVQISTAARGTNLALVTVRLRCVDPGTSVTARLFDITANAACSGVSASVSSQTWTQVQFNVTLTDGSHFYKLQINPTVANSDVAAAGAYVE